mmetsp:Transcript_75175/g.168335  ORF Transcript_75175/g.168335 Transcript_75175/m.168335 type:complete len:315 (-) Transcript_75175:9487-10431(-)
MAGSTQSRFRLPGTALSAMACMTPFICHAAAGPLGWPVSHFCATMNRGLPGVRPNDSISCCRIEDSFLSLSFVEVPWQLANVMSSAVRPKTDSAPRSRETEMSFCHQSKDQRRLANASRRRRSASGSAPSELAARNCDSSDWSNWRRRPRSSSGEGGPASLTAASTPCPGAGTERPVWSVAVCTQPTTAWMGAPIARARSPAMKTMTPQPCDSTKPPRVKDIGLLSSEGRRPASLSASALAVAFIEANSLMEVSFRSSAAPTSMTFAWPFKIVSTAIAADSMVVAQAPTGVLTGPEDERSNMFNQAAVVLMKLS